MNEQDLTEQVAGLQAQLAEYDEVAERSAVEGLAILETAAQKLADLTAERDLLREKLNNLKHAFGVAFTNNEQQMAEHVVRLQREIEDAREEIAQLKTVVPDLNLDLERAEIKRDEAQAEVAELKVRLKNCHREIAELRLSVERYQSSMQSTENVFKGRKLRIEEREAWAAKYIEEAYRERNASRAKCAALEQAIEREARTIRGLHDTGGCNAMALDVVLQTFQIILDEAANPKNGNWEVSDASST